MKKAPIATPHGVEILSLSPREESVVATNNKDGLTVRHDVRRNVALLCELSIAKDHQRAVCLSAKACAADGRITAMIIDASEGGLGVTTSVFIPLRTIVTMSVSFRDSDRAQTTCMAPMRIKRVIMTDRAPTYELGLSFHCPDEETQEQIHKFLGSVGVDSDA